MKKTILLIIFTMCVLVANAQKNFVWEVTDSTSKTKEQIYSDTKAFIAKTWRSAQKVIQNDDKEAGNIIIAGNSILEITKFTDTYRYVYRYTIEFKMKDNKYKMIIDDVYCDSANIVGKMDIVKIPPFDSVYVKLTNSFFNPTLSESKAFELMESLKFELESIVHMYRYFIKTESSSISEW